ncbi:MAG: hypothetical protein SWO11_17810 [Thermodesulfobacteriota bacterium]|nr:hypothetical protein [Thermodesulfobacteriota bacterium]
MKDYEGNAVISDHNMEFYSAAGSDYTYVDCAVIDGITGIVTRGDQFRAVPLLLYHLIVIQFRMVEE